MIYGERVRQVREMHRLTQSDLAEEIPDLTQSRLSRIESGLAEPDEETLHLLAFRCGVTAEYFCRPPIDNIAAHSPQMRARSRLTQSIKSAALQWATLIEEAHIFLRQNVRRLPLLLAAMHSLPPEAAAQKVRNLLGFGDNEPLPYLLLAVERLGVTVLGLPLKVDKLDAFCAWRDSDPMIAILSEIPGDRLRFNVAHELGHLVLHFAGQAGPEVEAEADRFAAELLMPRTAILDDLPGNPTLGNLTMLKTHWGVSVKSLVRRARELAVIDQDRAISLYKQMSSRGWNKVEPGFVPVEKPRALRKMTEILYGPSSNIARFANDMSWSEELTLDVVSQHAATNDLPFDGPSKASHTKTSHNVSAEVIDLRSRARRIS